MTDPITTPEQAVEACALLHDQWAADFAPFSSARRSHERYATHIRALRSRVPASGEGRSLLTPAEQIIACTCWSTTDINVRRACPVHGDGSSLKVSTPTQPTINMEQLQNARHRAEVELSKARNAMDCSSLGGRARTATARQRLQILNEEITRRVKAAEPPMPPPLEWDDLDKLRAQIAS